MRPVPIWERWQQDPVKREKMFKGMFFLMILVNVVIVVGFILFVVFFLYR